ncbi:MAG: MATE family efflux transporter [Bacilli bacterium]|jgi:Na+-driven multidrug efflux pump
MTLLAKFKKLFDPIDLTKGNIYKDITLFMIPIILSLIFQQLYSLTDAIIVGQSLSDSEIAGVNDAIPIVSIALNFSWGCTCGFSVVISNRIGAKKPEEARRSFLLQLCLSTFVTVVLTIVMILSINWLLAFIGISPSTEGSSMQAVYKSAYTYVFIISLGIIAQMAYNQIVSVLRAIGDSFTPFLFLVFSTVLNIGLDSWFILGLSWGVAGSAIATVLSELLAAIFSAIYVFVRYKQLRFRKGDFSFTWKFILEHLRLGLPLGFQFSILQIGIIIMQAAIVKYDFTDPTGTAFIAGTPAQVGYSVANKLDGILMSPFSALGTGMLSYMGQNNGAKDSERITKGFKASIIIGFFTWIIVMITGLLLTINGAYQHIFLANDRINSETLRYGNSYLYLACPCLVVLMILFIARNTLQGLNKPLFPFLAGIGELLARSLICLYVPALVNGGAIDYTASSASFYFVCAADPLAWLTATCILLIPLISMLRKQKKAIKPELNKLPVEK